MKSVFIVLLSLGLIACNSASWKSTKAKKINPLNFLNVKNKTKRGLSSVKKNWKKANDGEFYIHNNYLLSYVDDITKSHMDFEKCMPFFGDKLIVKKGPTKDNKYVVEYSSQFSKKLKETAAFSCRDGEILKVDASAFNSEFSKTNVKENLEPIRIIEKLISSKPYKITADYEHLKNKIFYFTPNQVVKNYKEMYKFLTIELANKSLKGRSDYFLNPYLRRSGINVRISDTCSVAGTKSQVKIVYTYSNKDKKIMIIAKVLSHYSISRELNNEIIVDRCPIGSLVFIPSSQY
ncbi:MAG: hypothetical protein HAW60_03385 [Bdellovibrionales bacterium]|nr:hypothetical protein [Bdellovibrionales bacterium]